MPTLAEIQAESDVVLSALEREKVREITGELPGRIDSLLPTTPDDLNRCFRADITAWDKIGDKTTVLAGGKSGVNVDKGRDRDLVRRRVRIRLGLPEVKEVTLLDEPDAIGTFTLAPADWRQRDEGEF